MTIRKFEDAVKRSSLTFAWMELVPIRQLRHFHNRLTRDFATAIIRCRLVKAESSSGQNGVASRP